MKYIKFNIVDQYNNTINYYIDVSSSTSDTEIDIIGMALSENDASMDWKYITFFEYNKRRI